MKLPHPPRISWHDLAYTLGPYVLLVIVAFWIASKYVRPAPPDTIVISAGREHSIFKVTAERYRKILEREGVKLRILESEGSLENLKRVADPKSEVEVGFVQGGLASLVDPEQVMSLGSVMYVPVLVFYRAPRPAERLSDLRGKRMAIGREGSGTRAMAETLLRANGIDGKPPTTWLPLEGADAKAAIIRGDVDVAFLSGDSAGAAEIVELIHTRGVRMFDFVQGDAYVARFRYLTKLELPPGALDLGKNLPEKPLTMIAPTVELLAKPGLHPALSDVLIEAARQVHGRANVLQKAGEFPAPLEHEYPLSDDALRYYKSGKSFAYRHLPFWLANLVDRTVILLVPLLVVLVPGLKVVPWLYRWRVTSRLYARYGELIALEREAFEEMTPERRAQMAKRLDEIEERVIRQKLPSWLAGDLYVLRQHIDFVRNRLTSSSSPAPPSFREPPPSTSTDRPNP